MTGPLPVFAWTTGLRDLAKQVIMDTLVGVGDTSTPLSITPGGSALHGVIPLTTEEEAGLADNSPAPKKLDC